MIYRILFAIAAATLLAPAFEPAVAQQPPGVTWRFVVSGDSRNCGDVVMPGIAETARKNQAAFYWHLGDLRLTTGFDEDIQHQPEHIAKPMSIAQYENIEWPDFIDSQIAPFGSIPFFLGIGNHEAVPPLKTREDFLLQFADWLESPVLRAQRLRDDPRDHKLKTYFHWTDRGVAPARTGDRPTSRPCTSTPGGCGSRTTCVPSRACACGVFVQSTDHQPRHVLTSRMIAGTRSLSRTARRRARPRCTGSAW